MSSENTMPSGATRDAVRARYEAATAELVEKLKADRSVLAAILCGSLAYDEVWDKSDIDLAVVVTDDLKEPTVYTLVEDGVIIHAHLMPRARFVESVHGSLQGAFVHSFLSVGTVLFSRDASIVELAETLGHLGGRDREIAMLRVAVAIIPGLDKAEKWLRSKRDPHYSFFWIMKLVDGLSQLEVLYHGQIPRREAVHQARRLNPGLVSAIYDDLIDGPKTAEAMEAALSTIHRYLLERRDVFEPLFTYLDEAAGPRSSTDIDHHFERQMGVGGAELALEWLAQQGLVQRLALPCRLMRTSRVSLEEAAYTR